MYTENTMAVVTPVKRDAEYTHADFMKDALREFERLSGTRGMTFDKEGIAYEVTDELPPPLNDRPDMIGLKFTVEAIPKN